jgi:hypothetical protein
MLIEVLRAIRIRGIGAHCALRTTGHVAHRKDLMAEDVSSGALRFGQWPTAWR